jgi:NYN domain
MSDRSAIFIDAGYLLAAAGQLCCGTTNRAKFECDYVQLTADLASWAREHSGGMGSLRTYWYDGAKNGVPTPDHEKIGGLPYVKVRLGRIHSGQQKGVDALIYRDLMTLARERAVSRAYLLSGDEDLREGVIAAQDMGVQVILIGIPTSQRSNQSAALVREADEHVMLSREHWATYFAPTAPTPVSSPASSLVPTPESARAEGRAFAADWLSRATKDDLARLLKDEPKIPGHLDLALVTEGEKSLGSLRNQQPLKHELRAGFWAVVDESQSPRD